MINKNILLTIIISLLLISVISSETIDYIVKKGDTLYSLARNFNVSKERIMEINGITSPDQLKSGVNLKIPENNLDYNQNNWYIGSSEYYVKEGDTYYSISRRNGITVSELLEINNLSESHILHVGDRLFLHSDDNLKAENTVESVPILTGSSQNGLFWPITGTRYKMDGKLEGVRINADAYSYVRSIAAGKVVLAEPYRGFGNVILIDVNGYIYLYGGNEDVFVNVGEEVAAGTRIGRLGMSDLSNGKKDMYFSVFKDGKPIDTSTAPRG
ncbi:MAG: LysM peptidoglycan-binding domain-containing protein [Spirochaetaceae bacterium]|nr:LysM peptidoglycan-binding domain-containing protein [Spirochaetaceae bacterium]